MSSRRRLIAVLALGCLVGPNASLARAQTSQDEEAIRAAGTAYQQALARGDGKALAELWTADGDIVDENGTVTKGRDTMSIVQPVEAAGRPEIRLSDTSLRFLAPGVAIEDGTVEVMGRGSSLPVTGRFSATWVRQGDAWKLACLREARTSAGAGVERLADLEWMVGDWTVVDTAPAREDAAGKAIPRPTIEVTVRWNANRTFLLRDMKIVPAAPPGGSEPPAPLHITQRIGWDPLSRQIRSWVFSSDGGHGEAYWHKDGDAWVARTSAVLPDGSQTSSLNVYTYDGKDRCTWQSLHTHAGSEHLPPVNMTMTRKPGRPAK